MEYLVRIRKLCQKETRKLTFSLGIIAISVLALQTLTLPYRNGLNSLFPNGKFWLHGNSRVRSGDSTYDPTPLVGTVPFFNASNVNSSSLVLEVVKPEEAEKPENDGERTRIKRNLKNSFRPKGKSALDNVLHIDKESTRIDESSSKKVAPLEMVSLKKSVKLPTTDSSTEKGERPAVGFSIMDTSSKIDKLFLLESDSTNSNNSIVLGRPAIKEMRCNMPPKTVMPISEMNALLLRRRGSFHSVKPQWSSIRDQELLSARSQINNAPMVKNDRELFAPLFRNISRFKRSYELMEQILKVYVYKEGENPIFHTAEMKGIYASEGWFMKLMERNQKFVARDPKKAHLFYMPFSTRMLEYSLYVRNSHNRTNLAQYLKNYTNMIAAKYSFWNRTSGTDHFFVGCHDWAPYETRHHMERCIKCMCNADVTTGFKIGKDVSLPETYVRSVRNPVRDIGGKPPSERPILAFFAGSIHGYLRRILLSHWENKDPDMKILGPMPPGVANKMTYIQHMQSSKYCICAKGYNVNSPRVVEAIFYECVPVIISDNFVPPLFDVLNWEVFSVIVAEKDIPILKEILLSIPYEKYLALQQGVKKVQRHFIWHSKPVKYDLFHMILHSIWHSRVLTIRPK